MNRTDLDHRLARTAEPLVIPALPPVSPQPGERPLHRIPLGLLHEPGAPRRTTDHLDRIPDPSSRSQASRRRLLYFPSAQRLTSRDRCSEVNLPSTSGANV